MLGLRVGLGAGPTRREGMQCLPHRATGRGAFRFLLRVPPQEAEASGIAARRILEVARFSRRGWGHLRGSEAYRSHTRPQTPGPVMTEKRHQGIPPPPEPQGPLICNLEKGD